MITLQEPAWHNANVYYDSTTNLPGIWSFWQVTRFENAYEFLLEPGEWYLDQTKGYLYYIPLSCEDLQTADVELPILETLIQGKGTLKHPIHNIQFKGLTFANATWLQSNNGYVADQSGFILVGSAHAPNIIGHDQHVVPSHGNISFKNAHDILFFGNIFEHLGGVGLYLGSGSKDIKVKSNLFRDISSSAIILGGVSETDARPEHKKQTIENNTIANNLIRSIGTEYVDAAAIFIGFSSKTHIHHNTISHVPWSGIAVGWGFRTFGCWKLSGSSSCNQWTLGNYHKSYSQSRMLDCTKQDNGFH